MKTSTTQATIGNGPDEMGGAQLAPGQMNQPPNPLAVKKTSPTSGVMGSKMAKGKTIKKKPIRSIQDLKDAAKMSKLGRQKRRDENPMSPDGEEFE